MGLIEKSKEEMETYNTPLPDKLSIQDALTILNVYVACQEPDDCRKHVQRIVEIEQNRPLFKEISEPEESTMQRINRYHNMLKNSDYREKAVDRAFSVLIPDHREPAFELAVQTCKAIGLTHTRRERLYDIAAKLSINVGAATEMIKNI